ncbi:hypothetical protein Phou_081470 [Phytohabitans houttuyneae]|uniref:Uncharacterized protein n=1 Tax=Phytohabitans houttuyneae TaxID=1076126 RepID=A0A6V8KQD3_9ACTN|nr:hypothetical protein Phou_081470 [Phytohabitans houttuyneae]
MPRRARRRSRPAVGTARPARPEDGGEQADSLPDGGRVPPGAVLFVEGHQGAVGVGAGGPAGVGEQHQGEQSSHLTVAGQEAVQQSREPDGLSGEVGAVQAGAGAGRVSLVEHQVQHVQHDGQAGAALRVGRRCEPGAGFLNLSLRAGDPLGHRRFRHQEGGRDLGGAQTADRAKGERELGGRRQGGVAAEKEQRERVIGFGVRGRPKRGVGGDGQFPVAASAVRAPTVDQGAAGDGQQPGARPVGQALGRPLSGGGEQRLLHGVLARVELAVPARERAENPRRELTQQILDTGPAGHPSMIRRTSIGYSV